MQELPQFERKLTRTEFKWRLISVAPVRDYLPAAGEKVAVYDDEGREYRSKMHSTIARIDGLAAWYRNHPYIGVGDTVSVTVLSHNSIRLSPKARSAVAMSYKNEVATAFDIVLEELENAIEGLNQDGAEAFKKADYDQARELMEKGSQMTAFRDKVYELQKEWSNIFATVAIRKRRRKRSKKASRRLSHGLRSPEAIFRVPILQTLVQQGGSAPVAQVLEEVSVLVKSKLNEYDFSSLPSTGVPRWQNTAQWTRHSMVKEGLLAADSPRGIWEITEKGRQWLQSQIGST